jgi:phosphatidylserine decarboxylase
VPFFPAFFVAAFFFTLCFFETLFAPAFFERDDFAKRAPFLCKTTQSSIPQVGDRAGPDGLAGWLQCEMPTRGLERTMATAVSFPALSRVAGWLTDRRLPPALLVPVIRAYSRVYGVDLSEAAEPPEAFPTFGAFFTRRLRDGARPVDTAEDTVVAPCDSRLSGLGPVEDGRLAQIKGRTYTLEALLGSSRDASTFRSGLSATLYLSPGMYHRVHSPVDGRVLGWRYLPGRLFPVNAPAVRSVPGLFTRNERVAVFLEGDGLGPIAVVLVGAANVGRITLTFSDLVTNAGAPAGWREPAELLSVRRGEEIGAFNLGSTVVLLAADPALVSVGGQAGALVRMGEALWRR